MLEETAGFDQFYADRQSLYGEPSDGLLAFLSRNAVQPCRVLDVGAGQGRNSLYLARNGFSVVAVELSISGSTAILDSLQAEPLHVRVVQGDFSTVELEGDFGLVVALTCLEHMAQDALLESADRIVARLEPGGWLYVVAFTVDDPGATHADDSSECARTVRHYFEHDELRSMFADRGLEVVEYWEYSKPDTSHGPVHIHGKAKLIARKPVR